MNFTNKNMKSKFESFSKNKMGALHKTEIMVTGWLETLYEYWDNDDTTYSDDFDFYPLCLFQY